MPVKATGMDRRGTGAIGSTGRRSIQILEKTPHGLFLGLGLDFDGDPQGTPAIGQVARVYEIVVGPGIGAVPTVPWAGQVKERFPGPGGQGLFGDLFDT